MSDFEHLWGSEARLSSTLERSAAQRHGPSGTHERPCGSHALNTTSSRAPEESKAPIISLNSTGHACNIDIAIYEMLVVCVKGHVLGGKAATAR